MCKRKDVETNMVRVQRQRHKILAHWYPADVRSPKAWVHKSCLAALGLYPFPDGAVPLAETIGASLMMRVASYSSSSHRLRW